MTESKSKREVAVRIPNEEKLPVIEVRSTSLEKIIKLAKKLKGIKVFRKDIFLQICGLTLAVFCALFDFSIFKTGEVILDLQQSIAVISFLVGLVFLLLYISKVKVQKISIDAIADRIMDLTPDPNETYIKSEEKNIKELQKEAEEVEKDEEGVSV